MRVFSELFADSVIFLSRPGEWEPPTGDYLGELTDEIAQNNGNHIVKFTSGGCKNYTYTTDTDNIETKVRGITLNARNSKGVNAATVERMVKSFVAGEAEEKVTITNPRKIVRNVQNKNIENRVFKKDYRIVFDKRWRAEGYNTLPYGYGVQTAGGHKEGVVSSSCISNSPQTLFNQIEIF